MHAFAKAAAKMEEEERQWEELGRIQNKGEYKVTQEFEIISEHEELKQTIQSFLEDIEQKSELFEILYEYYKLTAKTANRYKVKLVFVVEMDYNELKQLMEQLHFNLKSKSKSFKCLYEYYKKLRGC